MAVDHETMLGWLTRLKLGLSEILCAEPVSFIRR